MRQWQRSYVSLWNMPSWKKHKQYRWKGYDYSSSGDYFITINCKDRIRRFGNIRDKKIYLSALGIKAQEHINKFIFLNGNINPQNLYVVTGRPYCIHIAEHSILPDHVHLIVNIIRRDENYMEERIMAAIAPLTPGSVSSFINQFKGSITKDAKALGVENFAWQARFHDRVIRDEKEYHHISWYIQNNVINWKP